MSTLHRIYADFAAACKWVFVYTLEAHAMDEWPISSARADPSGKPVQIKQHTTLEERIAAAKAFGRAFALDFPVVVDTMANRFEEWFCTWPFRFYILRGGRVVFQAQPDSCTYSLETFVRALEGLAV